MDSFRLTKNGVLVLNGVVNDVYNNNSKKGDITDCEVLQDNDKANIIMLNNLHRCDLSDNSYVNMEIKNLIQI
jgi:hypothetical protein